MQIQPRKYVDHAGSTASTRQHELDHTDQEYICPERSRSERSYRSYRSSVRGVKGCALYLCPRFGQFPSGDMESALLGLESVEACQVSRTRAGSAGQHSWAVTFLEVTNTQGLRRVSRVAPRSPAAPTSRVSASYELYLNWCFVLFFYFILRLFSHQNASWIPMAWHNECAITVDNRYTRNTLQLYFTVLVSVHASVNQLNFHYRVPRGATILTVTCKHRQGKLWPRRRQSCSISKTCRPLLVFARFESRLTSVSCLTTWETCPPWRWTQRE